MVRNFAIALYIMVFVVPAQAEDPPWQQYWRGLPELVAILRTVPAGRAVLVRASERNAKFFDQVKTGEASFTETTFSRSYSLLDGKEEITLHHEITLNKKLALADAVVDLAHELVHYTEKGMLDPYRPGFELQQFVRNGIEGEGGELKALAMECKVAWELERAYQNFPRHQLCQRYRKPGNAFLEERARADYYNLGPWIGQVGEKFKKAIPELSGRAVVFTSSYAAKPYPVALAEEFAMTRKAACENNQRKYRLIAAQSTSGRQLASDALWREQLRLRAYDRLYCRDAKSETLP